MPIRRAVFGQVLAMILCLGISGCSAFRQSQDLATPQDVGRRQMELALKYFLDESHPATGLVRDRAENFSKTPDSNRMASLAATGFGLAVIANASTKGEVTREFARRYATKTLRFCRDHVPRHAGWFLHWVDWETGALANGSEYSTIDTAWFIAGALYAAQVLKDKQITAIARQLFNEIDFEAFLTDEGKKPTKATLSMAWKEETGFTDSQWDMYGEQIILLVLGLGHPRHPLPVSSWLAWDRTLSALPNGEKIMGMPGALFLHQYSQLFLDFRKFSDGFPNYADNSLSATRWQRSLMRRDPLNETLRAGFWGFSAGESPQGYSVWGPMNYQGVACIGCSVASAMFMPQEILGDMLDWYRSTYHPQIWGLYGFTDSIDIGRRWFSSAVLGITVGPEYLGLANMSAAHSVWKDFMQIPEVRRGLERAAGGGAVPKPARNARATMPGGRVTAGGRSRGVSRR